MQKHEWIVRILEDLLIYAEKNDLDKLGETIKNAMAVAIVETGCHEPATLVVRGPKLVLVKS